MSESTQQSQKDLRYDWYENDDYVSFSIFVPNIKDEDATLTFTDSNLTVSIDLPGNKSKQLNLTLPYRIIPNKTTYKIMPTKLEIKLMKLDLRRWTTITNKSERPTSKPARKDWAQIERNLSEEYSLEDELGSLSELFDDDVKKSLNKSYVDSCGTVLNMNWNTVSTTTVPVIPPPGLEKKQWQ